MAYSLLLLLIISIMAVSDVSASATTAASRKIEDSAFEFVKSMSTATFRDPRWSPPATISKEKVENMWTDLATTLIPPATTVDVSSAALPPKNVFHEWPGAFIGADKEQLPVTLFLPFSDEPSPSPTDKVVAAYHIVPKKLLLHDLLSMAVLSRLPTLVPGTSIVITNNSPYRFTLELDGVRVTKPELFVSKSIVIHRIASPLDYARNGGYEGGEAASSSFLVIASVTAIRYIRVPALILAGSFSAFRSHKFFVFLVLVSFGFLKFLCSW